MTANGIARNIFMALMTMGSCFAQPTESPYTVIKEFLGLTTDQEQKLLKMQFDHIDFLNGKGQRVIQVNQEINDETVKPTIDSNALGVRYLELEVICREARTAAVTLAKNSLTVLTDSQKTKLKQLEAAMSLYAAISEAQSLSLLPGGSFYGGASALIINILTSPNPGVYSYYANPSPGCRYPY